MISFTFFNIQAPDMSSAEEFPTFGSGIAPKQTSAWGPKKCWMLNDFFCLQISHLWHLRTRTLRIFCSCLSPGAFSALGGVTSVLSFLCLNSSLSLVDRCSSTLLNCPQVVTRQFLFCQSEFTETKPQVAVTVIIQLLFSWVGRQMARHWRTRQIFKFLRLFITREPLVHCVWVLF